MIKFGPIILVLLLMVGGSGYLFYNNSLNIRQSITQPTQNLPVNIPDDIADRVSKLEDTIQNLNSQIEKLSQKEQSSFTNDTSQPLNTPPQNAPLYIPLGWIGSANTLSWSTIPDQSIVINPSDYPGYKNMVFEANLLVYQGNGKASAMLINTTTNTPIYESIVNTTSGNFTWVSSSPFRLLDGQNTYKLQLQTTSSYTSTIENARIKVTY